MQIALYVKKICTSDAQNKINSPPVLKRNIKLSVDRLLTIFKDKLNAVDNVKMDIMDLLDGVANAHHHAQHVYHSINVYHAQNTPNLLINHVFKKLAQLVVT